MKIVKDGWEFKVEQVNKEVRYYSVRYTVESEGVEQRREAYILPHSIDNYEGLPQFSEQEETQISDFINNVVRPKVEEKEIGN